MKLVKSIRCEFGECQSVKHSYGPFCREHGCRRCGLRPMKELEQMPEPLCFECFDDQKTMPRMKKHPTEELIFHESISVDADKLSNAHLAAKVIPGLQRGDGKPMTVQGFRDMCRAARSNGYVVLPPCSDFNSDGTCRGHDAPKIVLETKAILGEEVPTRH